MSRTDQLIEFRLSLVVSENGTGFACGICTILKDLEERWERE